MTRDEHACGAPDEPRQALAAGVDPLLACIAAAEQSIEGAERTVDALLADFRRAPRAEKVTINAPLEEALQRLRVARAILANLVRKQ